MSWWKRAATHVWIFAVGRGNATFVRSGLNQGFLVDMGSGVDFSPSEFIAGRLVPRMTKYKKRGIAQAVLSHPHSDHITECWELKEGPLYPELLTCPHDKPATDDGPDERLNWSRIKNPAGKDDLIRTYKTLYAGRNPPLQTIEYDADGVSPGLEYGIYYVRPPIGEALHPSDDNKYGNVTSVMVHWRQGSHSILLPGDMTPEGMKRVLEAGPGREKRRTVFDRTGGGLNWHKANGTQPELSTSLGAQGLSVLVAPHHGLESCYSPELYAAMKGGKPKLVVISERRHTHEGDGTVDARYRSEAGASGWPVNIDGKVETRRSVSTVNGHHYVIAMPSGAPMLVYGSKDPEWLLAQL